jgi:hypothetical protein
LGSSRPSLSFGTVIVRDFNAASPPNGIISYLTSRFGGNVSDRGIVSIRSKSGSSADSVPKNAVNLTMDSRFGPKSEPDQWICYDFKNRRVEVRHYAIPSQFNDSAGHIRSHG